MKAFRKLGMVIGLTAVLVVVNLGAVADAKDVQSCKGLILLIGDGMGVNQVRSADIYANEVLGRDLVLNSIRTRGTTTTGSASSRVTDSAAAATALYTGYKTNNGRVNILPDGRSLSTIAHAAKAAQLAVGVVSTTRLTHATPAAVYARTPDRDDENCIAAQLPKFAPEVALGGGRRHFVPKSMGRKKSKRDDEKNLVQVMKDKGYEYAEDLQGLKETEKKETRHLFGLFADSHMAYDLDRRNVQKFRSQPTLADLTDAALKVLSRNPKGFFLMVEGGRIDHACHAHDLKAAIYDTIAFDDAVKVALDYGRDHPDVLVLVTADHETGGLGLGRGTEYALDPAVLKPIRNSLEYIDKQVKDDAFKLEEILSGAGYSLAHGERMLLAKHCATAKASDVEELEDLPKIDHYVFSWLHYALGCIETERAKIGWTSFVHTAQPVITYAVGCREEEFAGFYDNTDLAKRMCRVIGISPALPKEDEQPCRQRAAGASR